MTSSRTAVAAVIGDIVDSRGAPDRGALHARLVRGLRACPDLARVVRPFDITVGDEVQAVFADVGAAVAATLRLRLALDPDVDLRFGIGWGSEQVLDAQRTPPLTDGPAWWAARRAIEEAASAQRVPATRWTRTRYRAADGDRDDTPGPGGGSGAGAGPAEAWVNGVLALRDAQVDRLSERSRRLLAGGLSDRTQILMARDEGITQSAVSQAFARDGLGALVAAHRALEDP